jgi:glutathione S-transferase
MTDRMDTVELVGRSSSHFTRVVRIFALELAVPHTFRPLFDLTSLDAASYAQNPALKIPILVDERGPLFGAENICRELVRRATTDGTSVVMRGEVSARVVANAEELTLHAMSSGVSVIMARGPSGDQAVPQKVLKSLDNALCYLDQNLDDVLAALPQTRTLSFFEVALFCVVTHLPFRKVRDVTPFKRLGDFCQSFGERASAVATGYRFDAA